MGRKQDMLRKYLSVVGFGAILFGVIFFVMTMVATASSIDSLQAYTDSSATSTERFFIILNAAQTYGFQMFQGLTLGGICLYLAHRLSENNDG